MSALRAFASISLALLLGSGVALAQTVQTNQGDDPQHPNSHANKDREKGGDTSQGSMDQAEKPNPHSTMHNQDRGVSGDTSASGSMDQGQKDNPHHSMNKDRDKSGSMANGSNGKMTGDASPQMVLGHLNMANKHEIEMGKMAADNGTARAQAYGRMLQQDHMKAMQQVNDLAQKKGITLSDDMMMKDHDKAMKDHDKTAMKHDDDGKMKDMHAMHDKLAKLHGADFDKEFAKAMIDGHQKVIDHVQMWKSSVKDPDVTALLDQMMPVLQRHLQQAQELQRPAAQGRTP